MKVVLLSVLILLCPVLKLLAQQEGGDKPRQPRGRVAHLICTSIPEKLENPVDIMTGVKITPVTLSMRMPTDPVPIPADGIIRVVRKVPNPDDPAKPKYLTLAQASIPEGVVEALVILIPVPDAGEQPVFRTKVQDLSVFTGGDYLYLNLTNLKIAVEMGPTVIAIKPGEVKIYDSPALSKATNMPIRYRFYHPTLQQWKVISASTIVLQSTRREICIFSWDEHFKRVDYHGITFPVAR